MTNAIVVTTLDGEEIGREECPPDDYVIVLGPDCRLDGVQAWANGTVQLTIKRDFSKSDAQKGK